MAGRRVSLGWALALALGAAAPVAGSPSDAVAQEAPSGLAQQARNLDQQLQSMEFPTQDSVRLSAPRDITSRMVDAEVHFNLKEWANCATLLAPALEEPAMREHPASERAHFLVAESLFQSKSYEVARVSFQRILDLNHSTYRKQAMMRLLEIAIVQRNLYQVEAQYRVLRTAYGHTSDSGVHYLLARARYYRGEYDLSADDFQRVDRAHELYWRAQYHRAIAFTRVDKLAEALEAFETIERELADKDLPDADFDVLQLSRLGQGVIHYQRQAWDEAIRAYSSVERGSNAFEQALYQIAWTQIRDGQNEDAIANLEILALIAQNSRLVAEARLLSAEMLRREGDYEEALGTFESVFDDFDLIRSQLTEIRDEPGSVADRFDATSTILTGSVIAAFEIDHWFPNDESARRGLELVRESDELGRWVDFNQNLADEIDTALRSGFAYDRARDLRDTRARVVRAQRRSAEWRAAVLDAARQQSGQGVTPEQQRTEAARRAFESAPGEASEYEELVASERERLSERALDIYRQEQNMLMELDNFSATEAMLRDRVRLKLETPEEANRQRVVLRDERQAKIQALDALREERFSLQRRRIRYGIGEAQSASLEASRNYIQAIDAELQALNVPHGETLASLDALDKTIELRLGELDDRVKEAWTEAFGRLREEKRIVDANDHDQKVQRRDEIVDAERVAMTGFLAMLGNVDDVALRASLGEVDVAWWQKEGVSRRIESLFRERERQIRRLDADFSEIRE